MPTPFGRNHCPLQSGYFDSSCAAALVITVANARKNAMAPVGLLRGSMATSKELASKRKNTTHPRHGERAPRSSVRWIAHWTFTNPRLRSDDHELEPALPSCEPCAPN